MLKRLVKYFYSKFPSSKILLFESSQPFSCNTYPVYESLRNDLRFKNYKLVWVLFDKQEREYEKIGTEQGISCICLSSKNPLRWLRSKYYLYSCRGLISCNMVLQKIHPHQFAIFLGHGSKIKKTKGKYSVGNGVDYALCQADFFRKIMAYEYSIDESRLINLGYPRNDYLYQTKNVISILFPGERYKKVVVWLPTWRQHKTGPDKESQSQTGIPVIVDEEQMRMLNHFLTERDIFVILKPHPSQNLSYINISSMSNLALMDNTMLSKAGIQLYQILAQSDALITDYSSVLYDYLLTDRPIGLTFDDYDSYEQSQGFAVDIDQIHKVGVHIHTSEQLYSFLGDVVQGIDSLQAQRAEIRDLTNRYQDQESTHRVTDFIWNQLEKK